MNDTISQGLIITDPQSGKQYSLIKKLGEGAFGEVWLAFWVDDWHHQIAIKFFQPLEASDKQQFLTEYQQSVQLNHKDVLPSLFYGEWNNRLFIGMDYCEYGTAAQFVGTLTPGNKEDENLIWNIIYDTAKGLEYLHENQRIVHQDIKPDNIMIKSEGDFVIMDFGISVKVGSRMVSDNYKNFGSPAYMAPERYNDSDNIIFANDIWSFGVMIYELAAGELPFNGLGGNYVFGAVPSIAQGWSQELNKVMQSCLVYEPWSRKKAKDIKEYADWILRGKRGADPWGNYCPDLTYPDNSASTFSTSGSGRDTQRAGGGQSGSSSISSGSQNGRDTARNAGSSGGIQGQSSSHSDNLYDITGNNQIVDEDMKYKKKSQIMTGICVLLCCVCVGGFIYLSKKMNTIRHTLNETIQKRDTMVQEQQHLLSEICIVCENHDDESRWETMPNWKSSNHENSTQEKMEYVISGQKGDELNFSYKVDSEPSYDKLKCYLKSSNDNIQLLEVSGLSKSGIKKHTLAEDGEYTLTFVYEKDNSYSKGTDMAEISEIKFKRSVQNEILDKIKKFNDGNIYFTN